MSSARFRSPVVRFSGAILAASTWISSQNKADAQTSADANASEDRFDRNSGRSDRTRNLPPMTIGLCRDQPNYKLVSKAANHNSQTPGTLRIQSLGKRSPDFNGHGLPNLFCRTIIRPGHVSGQVTVFKQDKAQQHHGCDIRQCIDQAEAQIVLRHHSPSRDSGRNVER
jgi:hypothetical protein